MNQRKRAVVLLLGIMLTVQATSAAEVRDDFSEPGTWQRKNDTPGELEQRSGRLLLRDAASDRPPVSGNSMSILTRLRS